MGNKAAIRRLENAFAEAVYHGWVDITGADGDDLRFGITARGVRHLRRTLTAETVLALCTESAFYGVVR